MENIGYYDPRVKKTDRSSKEAEVWTSESVEIALECISLGQPIKKSPFHEGKTNLRKGDLVFKWSPRELEELIKCRKNIHYFIEKYCRIKRPDGKIGNFKLRPYQLNQVKDYLDNDEVILAWSRQSGKTVGTALYIIWCMCFNVDKQAAILANKSKTSKEVLDKIKAIYDELPFWLKPGIEGINESVLAFDNGCRIYTGPTTPDALNGKTCNILYIDEFAYIGKGKNKIEYQRDFLANAIPVLSSQKNSGLMKLIISSTPMGKEYFYTLLDDAMKGRNNMKWSKVAWWEIPNTDIVWARGEIAKIGLTKFRQQYEISFDVSSKTLLDAKTMKRLVSNKIPYLASTYDLLSNYEDCLYWHPDVELDAELDVFCLSVDIAEGLGQDYSTIQIFRLGLEADNKTGFFDQVGVFACNTISIADLVKVVQELFTKLNPEYSKLIVEYNTYGGEFFKILENNTDESLEIPDESICKFKRTMDSKTMSKGLRTNRNIKPTAVKSMKSLMDNESITILDMVTVDEVENFQQDAKGNFNATIGHDDRVTPIVNFSYWVDLKNSDYDEWLEDFRELNNIEYSMEDELNMEEIPDDVKEFL